MWLDLAVPWVGLQCVVVVFPDQTYLLFLHKNIGNYFFMLLLVF